MGSFNIGDVNKLTLEVKNSAGQLANPDEFRVEVKPPKSAGYALQFGTSSITNPSTGIFVLKIPCTEDGTWLLDAFSVGNDCDAGQPHAFNVLARRFTL